MWHSHASFKDMVTQASSGIPLTSDRTSLGDKLERMEVSLTHWNWNVFVYILKEIESFKRRIEGV